MQKGTEKVPADDDDDYKIDSLSNILHS